MNIIKLNNLTKKEIGYQLETGDYAAVSYEPGKNTASDMFAWQAIARAVNKDGQAIINHLGKPIEVCKHISCPKLSLVNGKAKSSDIKQQALDQVINGEDGLLAELAAVKAYLE